MDFGTWEQLNNISDALDLIYNKKKIMCCNSNHENIPVEYRITQSISHSLK